MKWLKAKHTYTLIVLSLVLSAGLQLVWLDQLFRAQKKQLQQDIEQVVSNASKLNNYKSLVAASEPSDEGRIKKVFLSPQWILLRQAFDNMKVAGLEGSRSIIIQGDSLAIQLHFSLYEKPQPVKNRQDSSHVSKSAFLISDSAAFVTMHNSVMTGLKEIDINLPVYHKIYTSGDNLLQESDFPQAKAPGFESEKYPYNLDEVKKYQLVLNDINPTVLYRMRYYIASSVLMILLTCLAFYFILRLLRNQQLYADARSDFASNMTHEFKTPIATVALALESITKYNLTSDPETLKNYLDISQHELQRLNLMVEKVLNISQEDDAGNALNSELYEVQAGLEQVINSMKLQLLQRHASIHLMPSEEPCFVFGDAVHLSNIFYNLIDNAIKYAGDAFSLEIRCTYQQHKVIISFKDNGPGIEKIYQERIFERFYRVPGRGDTHDVKGSGLGLHYVRQMVEKHGGRISLKSEPGKGSDFIITLPAAT
jgi:signal transduction histidine kinase